MDTFIKVGSHRARHKLESLLGKLDWYYTWETAGCLVKIPVNKLQDCRHIKSVTQYRGKSTPMKCWNS